MADCNSSENFYGSQDIEAASATKKYGGLAPKKKPLISKDHERAFFDSADWALCKQGAGVNQKSTVAIETLRPKLQRTPHHPLPPRRPACTSGSNAGLDWLKCSEEVIICVLQTSLLVQIVLLAIAPFECWSKLFLIKELSSEINPNIRSLSSLLSSNKSLRVTCFL